MWVKSVVFVIICSLSAVALADEAATEARRHYERATSLYDVGRFAEAAQEYEAAYQLKNDPALLFNLGQAYRIAGQYSKAIFAYRGYLRRVPDADNRAEVEGHIAKSQQLLDEQNAARPAATASPVTEPKPTAPSVIPAASSSTSTRLTATAPPRRKPVYKQWWLWTTVGVVAAAGAGVGLYFALTTPSGTRTTPVFPAVGSQP